MAKGVVVCVNNPPGIASLIERILPHREDIARIVQNRSETAGVARLAAAEPSGTNNDGLPLPTEEELASIYHYLLQALDVGEQQRKKTYGCAKFGSLFKSGHFLNLVDGKEEPKELGIGEDIYDVVDDQYPKLKDEGHIEYDTQDDCCHGIGLP